MVVSSFNPAGRRTGYALQFVCHASGKQIETQRAVPHGATA
jgi:hypothetical protein